jgi:hypothetical protein
MDDVKELIDEHKDQLPSELTEKPTEKLAETAEARKADEDGGPELVQATVTTVTAVPYETVTDEPRKTQPGVKLVHSTNRRILEVHDDEAMHSKEIKSVENADLHPWHVNWLEQNPGKPLVLGTGAMGPLEKHDEPKGLLILHSIEPLRPTAKRAREE